ncbi:FkbM family methyltransferase [Amorphus sp. 3PC139-8]
MPGKWPEKSARPGAYGPWRRPVPVALANPVRPRRFASYPDPSEVVRENFSFAQNWEDVYLWRALSDVERGFYVDVGALDPAFDSVTKLFYDRGWSGVNVEPGSSYARLAAARPRDTNLQVVVGETVGEVDFHEVLNGGEGLSYVAGRGANAVLSWPTARRRRLAMRLRDILDLHAGGQDIHFLKIDVEGSEADVVRSADWTRHRPWLIVVEATVPTSSTPSHQTWEPILLEAGYERVFFDGLNMYYVRQESRELAAAFDRPVSVLDGFRQFDAVVAAMHADLIALETALDTATSRLSQTGAGAGEPDSASLSALLEPVKAQLGGVREDTATLTRLRTRYRLDGATAELRFGLWTARKLRKLRRLVSKIGGAAITQ